MKGVDVLKKLHMDDVKACGIWNRSIRKGIKGANSFENSNN